jgi:hypothetical protein
MQDRKTRDKDARLLMTFLIFIFVAVPVTSSIFESPRAANKAISQNLQVSMDGLGRSPASVSASKILEPAQVSSGMTFEFDCNKPSLDFSESQIRWTGKWCAGKEWTNLEVVNQTNGFTASVMPMKDLKFTTDFVDLVEGENEFSFKATLAGGEVVQKTIKVFRRMPTSQVKQSL